MALLHRRRQRLQILAARPDRRLQLQQSGSCLAVLQGRRSGSAGRVQARRHTAHGQGRHLYDGRHVGGRWRWMRKRANSCGSRTAFARVRGRLCRRASSQDAASPTGPTAVGMSASSTSPPATDWRPLTPKTASRSAHVGKRRNRRHREVGAYTRLEYADRSGNR